MLTKQNKTKTRKEDNAMEGGEGWREGKNENEISGVFITIFSLCSLREMRVSPLDRLQSLEITFQCLCWNPVLFKRG